LDENNTPRKNCRHINAMLEGILDTRKIKTEKEKTMKASKTAKVVVKAAVSPKLETNVKKASEVIFKLISKQPGKLQREGLRDKSGLDRGTVAAACARLWAAKKIFRIKTKTGLNGAYILRKATV
jgi:hypothetical protein